MSDQKPAANKGCLITAVILLGLCGACGISFIGFSNSPEQQAKRAQDQFEANVRVVCKDAVRARLKSPTSADFPWGVRVREVGVDRYEVSSYVDAQNGFGAKLRTQYTCIVDSPNKETVRVSKLEFGR